MLPNYDDFLVKRLERPDEVPAFAEATAWQAHIRKREIRNREDRIDDPPSPRLPSSRRYDVTSRRGRPVASDK